MGEVFKKELEESIEYWEKRLEGVEYRHPDGRKTSMFDELLPPEKIKRILGE